MNLPNKITFCRILLLPVFLAIGLLGLFVYPWLNFVSIAVFIILAFTDFLDGYIARKYNLVTNLGKFLDPIADKLLCTTGLLLLIIGGNPIIPNPYGIICIFIILLRDYAVTGLRQIAQLKGVIIPADKLGKIKANFQYVLVVFGFLICGLRGFESVNGTVAMNVLNIIFYVFTGITTALVLVSGIIYIAKNTSVFADDEKKTVAVASSAESTGNIASSSEQSLNATKTKNTSSKTTKSNTSKNTSKSSSKKPNTKTTAKKTSK